MSAVHDVWKRGLKLGPVDYMYPPTFHKFLEKYHASYIQNFTVEKKPNETLNIN